jgi:hypothetical protein
MDDDADYISPADGKDTPEVARKWLDVIARSDRVFETWRERVRKILKIYTDDRQNEDSSDSLSNRRRLNVYWANIQTIQPAVYQKLPSPSVARRWKDDDRVARVAGEMVERAVSFSFDRENMDATMRQVRDDYLHTGRGQVWVRYEPEISKDATGADKIETEYVPVDHVHWADFGHNIAREWNEVTCVWRKAYLTKAEGVKRFGDKFNKVGLDHKPDEDERANDPAVPTEAKATVYEIWCKATGLVYWIAKSYADGPLEVAPPHLKFEEFFPCPAPCYGTLKGGTLIPVPDYVLYQDQLEEIDELTMRMGKLLDALKLVGFYPSSSDEGSVAIEKALKPGVENVMIPVPTWGEFKEGGGAAGKIEWLPVENVVKVLQACFEARKQLIEDVHEITGISDIMRGETEPSETKGAQVLKSQWGSLRIRDKQHELARFARDVARLVAEVMCDQFSPDTLMAMTNTYLPTQEQVLQQQQAALQMALQAPPPAAAGPVSPPGPSAPGGPPSAAAPGAGGPPPQGPVPQ